MTYLTGSATGGAPLDSFLVTVDAREVAGPAVEISNLTMSYGGRAAVTGLDLEIQRGRFTVVLGPNGAGKTTSLEVCEGLRKIQGGQVRVLGLDPRDPKLRPLVGVMLQGGGAYSGAHAVELVAHFARLYRTPLPVKDLCAALSLHHLGRTTVRRMSGGEKARLSLALALVGRPQLAFLDEPSAGLDPEARVTMWQLLEQLHKSGVTVVLTTHQLDEAEHLAQDVILLVGGRLRRAGTLAELTRPDSPQVTFRLPNLTHPLVDLRTELDRLLRRLGPSTQLDQTSDGRLRITESTAPQVLVEIVGWASELDLSITDVASGPRTLAEVYHQLVGAENGP